MRNRNKNLERFTTDISEFKGKGIEIKQVEDAAAKPHVPNGIAVKLLSGEEAVIERTYAVFNKVFYDYQGVVKRNGELQKVYFNNEDIENLHTFIGAQSLD